MKIGLGLYTVYQELIRDTQKTLNAAAAMGYTGVEFYGERNYRPDILKELLIQNKLEICGWHTEWKLLKPDTIAETIQYHQTLGNCNIIIPALGGPWNIGHTEAEDCAEVWKRHCEEMNQIHKTLKKEGLRLGYHTHAHEFSTKYQDITAFDILCENADPEIYLELDTGNCIEGGGDPVVAMADACNRMKLIHCKPYSKIHHMESILGEDDVNDWPSILNQCMLNQTDWLIVENEAEKMGDKLEVAQTCLNNLNNLLNLNGTCGKTGGWETL